MKQILAVDDSSSNLQMVKSTLQKEYIVSLVNNGERAIQFLEKKHLDLILLDIMMPGLDGFETLLKIKELPECADIPIIMLSAMVDDDTEQECKELGAVGVMTKPFLPGTLLDTVRSVINSAGTNSEKER